MKKSKEALESFKSALEFFPFNREVLLYAGISAFESGLPKLAETFIGRILDMTPDDNRALAILKKVRNKK
jgi:tetratricopeptide (TPR) repeat protein